MKQSLLILFFILLSLFSLPLSAESIARSGVLTSFCIPFYTGTGYSAFLESLEQSEGGDYETNPTFGFSFSITREYVINPVFSFQGEIQISGMGTAIMHRNENDDESSVLISEINLDFPLLLKAGFPATPNFRLYGMAGTQFSYHLLHNIYEQTGAVFNIIHPSWASFSPVGAGILTALGMEFFRKSYSMIWEVRYLYELTDSMDEIGINHQNALFFTTGFRFGKTGDKS